MADGLMEAIRGLWLADPGLAPKPLLAKLQEQQLDFGAGTREVREALTALKAKESEGMEAIAAAQLATEEMVPPNAAFPRASGCSRSVQPALEGLPPGWSRALCVTDAGTEYTVFSKPGGSTCDTRKKAWDVYRACHGCARSPSEMGDGRQTHPECQECFLEGRPTLFFCGLDCPANPGAWDAHKALHQERQQKCEVGGQRSIVMLMEARALRMHGLPVAAGLAPEPDDDYLFQLTVDRTGRLLELRARRSRSSHALWHVLAGPFECRLWDHRLWDRSSNEALTTVCTLMYRDDAGATTTITFEEVADRDPSIYSCVRDACAAAPLPAGEAVDEEAPQKQGEVARALLHGA